MWTMKYSDLNTDIDWKKIFQDNFLGLIKFHKIPANVLMKDVDPLKVVPNDIIVTALAYQVRFFIPHLSLDLVVLAGFHFQILLIMKTFLSRVGAGIVCGIKIHIVMNIKWTGLLV